MSIRVTMVALLRVLVVPAWQCSCWGQDLAFELAKNASARLFRGRPLCVAVGHLVAVGVRA